MNVRFFIWLCFSSLSATLTSALVSENSNNACSAGPSSWCTNYKKAKECNAVEYCLKNGWVQEMLPVGGGEYCEGCKLVADNLRDIFHIDKAEDKIKQAMRLACTSFASKEDLLQQCNNMVDNSVPLVLGASALLLEQNIVCFPFCKTSPTQDDNEVIDFKPLNAYLVENKVNSLLPASQKIILTSSNDYINYINKPTINKSDICEDCKSLLQSLSHLLQDKNTEEVVHGVVKITCSLMPTSIQAQCNSKMFEYTELVVTLIGQAINPERLCQIMKFCQDY